MKFFALIQWPLCILSVLILMPCGLVLAIIERKGRLAYKVYKFFCWTLLKINRIKLRSNGLEFVDPDESYIVCSNHQGMFDIFSLMVALPIKQLCWISKPAYFRIPIVGWVMRLAGCIEVERTGSSKDRDALDKAVGTIKKGVSIAIFPEGHRTKDGTVGPFKRGAFYIANHSGRPILPITIKGSFERMPKGRLYVLPGVIECTVHPPINPQGYSLDELRNKTRDVIISA